MSSVNSDPEIFWFSSYLSVLIIGGIFSSNLVIPMNTQGLRVICKLREYLWGTAECASSTTSLSRYQEPHSSRCLGLQPLYSPLLLLWVSQDSWPLITIGQAYSQTASTPWWAWFSRLTYVAGFLPSSLHLVIQPSGDPLLWSSRKF